MQATVGCAVHVIYMYCVCVCVCTLYNTINCAVQQNLIESQVANSVNVLTVDVYTHMHACTHTFI